MGIIQQQGVILAATLALAAGVAIADEIADLKAAIERAPQLQVEKLCAPIKSTRGGGYAWVPNPDGKSCDLLIHYYNTYWGPHTTVIIDFGTGEIKKEVVERALYQSSVVGPDGKLYGHRTGKGGTAIYIYDPATNSTSMLPETVPIDGETRPIVIGTDGMLYGAGSLNGRACAYQLNPATQKITYYGLMGPSHEPNACWGYTVAADAQFVYVASGKIPWYCVAFNKATGKDEVLVTNNDPTGYLEVSQGRYGVTCSSRSGGKGESYWLHQGKAIVKKDPKEKAPWEEPAQVKPWVALPPTPELGQSSLVPGADGKVQLWYRTPEAKAAAPKDAPADAKPETLGWRSISYEVPTYPAPVYHVTALADGRICGSGGSYLGNFLYDPKTNTSRHLGRLPLSHYCTAVLDGIVYMSGYPSSALYAFDPSKPWTVEAPTAPGQKALRDDDKDSNPRRLAYLSHAGAGTHKMWSAAVGADGKVYFGGRWYRNGEGGGLGWWDPKEQKAAGISAPFANYQVSFITAADSGRFIVISTLACRDQATGTPAPAQGKLFVFDTKEGRIVRDFEPVQGAVFAGAVAGGKGTSVLGMTYDPTDPAEKIADKTSVLYAADIAAGKILWTKKLPYPVGFLTNENFDHHEGFDFQTGPDGKVWTYTGGQMTMVNPEMRWGLAYTNGCLVRINPTDGKIEVVGKIDRIGDMAFVGKDLYLAGGSKYYAEGTEYLRRVKGIVP